MTNKETRRWETTTVWRELEDGTVQYKPGDSDHEIWFGIGSYPSSLNVDGLRYAENREIRDRDSGLTI